MTPQSLSRPLYRPGESLADARSWPVRQTIVFVVCPLLRDLLFERRICQNQKSKQRL
jgi:hypothetical protein